ncbi:chorismate mutase [Candidatus Uabimicrobium sp. HlEnr_7]|uniref:chorismate mutase n=1 Tax=Candidatus Uabimicrobium helgolandensis TaxID=3095367 RepID=UPI0035569759
MTDSLESLRQKMEEINTEMLKLLNARTAISLQIKEIKQQKGVPFFDMERERLMLENIAKNNDGPTPAPMTKKFFEEVFKISRACMEQETENIKN